MSRNPHTCPKCEGARAVDGVPCVTCEASGVVWQPEQALSPQEAAAQQAEALDLTYRG